MKNNNIIKYNNLDVNKLCELYNKGLLTFSFDPITNEYVLKDKNNNEIGIPKNTYKEIIEKIRMR